MTPGFLAIVLAAATGVLAWISAVRWARGNEGAEVQFRWAYHAMTFALGIACALLMAAILLHDFRFDYVIGYSSRDLPMIYLVSAFWGGQEGTYLLWAFLGALFGYPLFRKKGWEPSAVMAFYVPTVLFLVALMIHPDGNPFRLAPQVPPDGRGLNLLLQDPWMAFHPPAVFVGYAAMTVPAALALAAIFRKVEDRWLGPALRAALVGFVCLGVGIIMGGFWAYKVLGWGGYWGWDPVENASLIPWIVVTALVHGLLVQNATGALRRTNLALALGGYLLVLYATFLTRSGVLSDFSVHSFAESSLYWWLVAIMVIVLMASTIALIRREGPESSPVRLDAGWPLIVTSAICLFVISAAIVLIGTSWPIITDLFGTPATAEISFYNAASLPIYVVALVLLGIAPFSGWRVTSPREWGVRVWITLAVAVVGTAAAYAFGGHGVKYLLLFLAGLFALGSNLVRVLIVARMRFLAAGAAIAHLGFAMMVVGIVTSSAWDRTEEIELPLGHPVSKMERIFTYRGRVAGSEPQDRWRIGVMRPGEDEIVGEVTMFQFDGPGGQPSRMSKPAILSTAARDLYVAPLGLETGTHQVQLTMNQPAPYHDAMLTLLRFETGDADEHQSGMSVNSIVRVERRGREPEEIALPVINTGRGLESPPVRAASFPGATFILDRMSVEQRAVLLRVQDADASETLVATASVKPLIGLLWAGTIVMTLGCIIAFVRRQVDEKQRPQQAGLTQIG
jgi:cytochrome c-type biogenesis protein CcmF